MNQPRFIGSASPFKQWAEKYFQAGFNPIPLPPGQKNPPPTGFTGHGRPMVDWPQLGKWLDGGGELRYPITKANIALRLNTVEVDGKQWDLVGIDVDHHPEDKDDPKEGGPQLEYFEKKFGKLPDTWTSSARTNGVAGIRFYRAPAGFAYRGDMGPGGEDIDIISKNYRFAVVFPSTNPDANDAQYWWYPPGFAPNGEHPDGKGLFPDPKDLPVLSEEWVKFLTQGKMLEANVPMDMNSSNKQLIRWATKNFADNSEICDYLRVELDKWKVKLEESANSHNILTKAHNHIIRCGANEGHTGWGKACVEFEKAYAATVLSRKKRTITKAKAEIERSKIGVLRRIKGEADEMLKQGVSYFDVEHRCTARFSKAKEIVSPPTHYNNFPRVPAKPPGEYEATDWGNANWFSDIHKGLIHHVSNGFGGWIIWNGERWVHKKSPGIPRALFRRVAIEQEKFATEKMNKAIASGDTNRIKAAAAYKKFAQSSGELPRITKALDLASTLADIEIQQQQLDSDRWAMGVINGVLKWATTEEISRGAKPLTLIENTRELLITKNTGTPYIPLNEQINSSDPQIRRGAYEFGRFLKLVQPDKERRNYLQKLLGQTLLGENPAKIAIFFYGPTNTGKTTLLELMIQSIGDYGAMRPARIYTQKDLHPMLATAFPMRIVGTDELADTRIASDMFKQVTGNTTMSVELKQSNEPFEDKPQFTPIIPTNSPPPVPGEDEAFRGRIVTITFNENIKSLKGDRAQAELYKDGQMACLAWLIEGCTRAINEGIRPFPADIARETADFAAQLSDIGLFIRDCLEETDEDVFIPNNLLQQHFEFWAFENNYDVKKFNMGILTKRLKSHNFRQYPGTKRIEGRKTRGWIGMRLVNTKVAESQGDSN